MNCSAASWLHLSTQVCLIVTIVTGAFNITMFLYDHIWGDYRYVISDVVTIFARRLFGRWMD